MLRGGREVSRESKQAVRASGRIFKPSDTCFLCSVSRYFEFDRPNNETGGGATPPIVFFHCKVHVYSEILTLTFFFRCFDGFSGIVDENSDASFIMHLKSDTYLNI